MTKSTKFGRELLEAMSEALAHAEGRHVAEIRIHQIGIQPQCGDFAGFQQAVGLARGRGICRGRQHQARLGLAEVLLAAGRRDEAIRELEGVIPRIAEGRLPLLELRLLVLRESAGAVLPVDKARRVELVRQLKEQLPADFPVAPDFNQPPFPIS